MTQTETMTVGDGIMGAVAGAVLGWLGGSFTKVSKADFEKMAQRIDALEKDLTGRMTRTEFEQAFSKVERLVWDFRSEARSEFRDLKGELKTKT